MLSLFLTRLQTQMLSRKDTMHKPKVDKEKEKTPLPSLSVAPSDIVVPSPVQPALPATLVDDDVSESGVCLSEVYLSGVGQCG